MAAKRYEYVIIGGGLAGASAVEGIRELDTKSPILLISNEKHLPYHRPPLTKGLWSGKKKVGEIFVQDRGFYDKNGVELALGTVAVNLEASARVVTDSTGREVEFGKCLIATGGIPKKLPIAGGRAEGVCYYRYLDDYETIRQAAGKGTTAAVIGGGFIGSEIAAALSASGVDVIMVYAGRWLCDRVFTEDLGRAMEQRYRQRGITIWSADQPGEISRQSGKFVIQTRGGRKTESDLAIVGVGIEPAADLASRAGLQVDDGIIVDQYLRTSTPNVWAAGDNACFPYQALRESTRVEHWDNARAQGKQAGRNMAGARESYDYMPYFFADLFEFGYEAVGDTDPRLDTFADWQKPNDTGVVYYLSDHIVRGVMMCNVWDKVDEARQMIRRGQRVETQDLVGGIK